MNQPILHQTGFIPFLIARVFAMFAMQIQAIVIAWHLYDVTKDPMALAWSGLAQFIPMALCLPIAGDVADRYNRKWVLGIGLFMAELCSIVLMWVMTLGATYVMWSYVALMGFGVARSFINPTLHSLLPQIVSKDTLPQSLATNSTLMKISVITGPVVGGFLYGWVDAWSYAVCTLFYILAILPLFGITLKYADTTPIADTFNIDNIMRRFRDGIAFIWSNPVVLGAKP